MGRWGDAVNKAGGGVYLDLQPGKNLIRVLNDPVVQNKQFEDGPSTIFTWAVWDYAAGAVRLLSKGVSFLKKFDFYSESYGDVLPMKTDILIQKTGSGLGTRYEFAPIPVAEELPHDWEIQLQNVVADYDKLLPGSFSVNQYSQADKAARTEPMAPTAVRQPDPVIEDIGDEPIDLSDIPFSQDLSAMSENRSTEKKE